MKFVSLDIETSGLDPRYHQVMEVGLVFWDTDLDIPDFDRPYTSILVPSFDNTYRMCPKVAYMHTSNGLLDDLDIAHRKQNNEEISNDPHVWYSRESEVNSLIKAWLTTAAPDERRFNVAGKNVAGFDLKFLYDRCDFDKNLFRHRTIDPAHFYTCPEDEVMPDLETCKRRAGISNFQVGHRAIADAFDVAVLIHKFWKKNK